MNLSWSERLVNCDRNQKMESEDQDLVAEVKDDQKVEMMVEADSEMEWR